MKTKKTNKDMAIALRELANRLERCSVELMPNVEISIHGCVELEQLRGVATLTDGIVSTNNSRGAHWVRGSCVGIDVIAYYQKGLLSKTTRKVRVVESESNPDTSVLFT